MIVRKPVSNRVYANLAIYCNENNCHIEDEAWYLDLDREVTAYIEEHFPYPEESES